MQRKKRNIKNKEDAEKDNYNIQKIDENTLHNTIKEQTTKDVESETLSVWNDNSNNLTKEQEEMHNAAMKCIEVKIVEHEASKKECTEN